MKAYRDSVNEVRVGASEGLQRLCNVCGADWLQEKVLPRIHSFYDESTFYLIRIAILNALKKLANGEVRVGSVGPCASPRLLQVGAVAVAARSTTRRIVSAIPP